MCRIAEIENLAMGHAAVAEAAVIAVPSEKWGERPLLVVALKAHSPPAQTAESLGPRGGGSDNGTVKEQLYK